MIQKARVPELDGRDTDRHGYRLQLGSRRDGLPV
jgi:hypothetical protein